MTTSRAPGRHASSITTTHCNPVMRSALARHPPLSQAEESAATRGIVDRRLAAWRAVLADPARSPDAVRAAFDVVREDRTDVHAPNFGAVASALPWTLYSYACDEAARSRPRSAARARLPAMAALLAPALASADRADDVLRAAASRLVGPHAVDARTALAGLDAAVRALVLRNLRLVASMARAAHHAHVSRGDEVSVALDVDDLISHGCGGLERGVRGFDPSRGVRLSTYVVPWIREAMTRACANLGRVIRLPVHMLATLGTISAAVPELAASLGRDPTDAEVAAALGRPVAPIARAREGVAIRVRPTMPRGADCGPRSAARDDHDGLADAVFEHLAAREANEGDPETILAESEDIERRRSIIAAALAVLTDREREMFVRIHIGGHDEDGETITAVGASWGITRERARQIANQATRKIEEFRMTATAATSAMSSARSC